MLAQSNVASLHTVAAHGELIVSVNEESNKQFSIMVTTKRRIATTIGVEIQNTFENINKLPNCCQLLFAEIATLIDSMFTCHRPHHRQATESNRNLFRCQYHPYYLITIDTTRFDEGIPKLKYKLCLFPVQTLYLEIATR